MGAALGVGLVATVVSLAGAQIGYLWSFEELAARADLVVIARRVRTDDTGRRAEHPQLSPDLPVVELQTTFEVLAVLKADPRPASSDRSRVRLKHYRLDWDEWLRRNPTQPGLPPRGLVNAGSYLDFALVEGAQLLFLARAEGGAYEPLSGHAFPTDSVYELRKPGRPPG